MGKKNFAILAALSGLFCFGQAMAATAAEMKTKEFKLMTDITSAKMNDQFIEFEVADDAGCRYMGQLVMGGGYAPDGLKDALGRDAAWSIGVESKLCKGARVDADLENPWVIPLKEVGPNTYMAGSMLKGYEVQRPKDE